jgi:hypothetical protein
MAGASVADHGLAKRLKRYLIDAIKMSLRALLIFRST